MENREKQFFQINPKNQIYIISAVFGIIILFLILFFVFPILQEIEKNSEDLVSGKDNLAFLEDQVSEVEKFKKDYETYKPNLDNIDKLYVDSQNPADFFKFLEETAQDCQVRSKVSLLSDMSGKENLAFLNFQIFSQGDLPKILKFFEKLETGPYLIEIQNLSIASSNQENATKKNSIKSVDVNFLIKAYIQTVSQ